MLDQVNLEDWGSVQVLSGSANHVPEAIMGLLSSNKVDFDKAYWKLDNHIVVQGDLFSSAALVPKYLEEVVLKTKFKEPVIDLLWQIGSGYSSDNNLQSLCYENALKVLKNLSMNSHTLGKKYVGMINGEIKELEEFIALDVADAPPFMWALCEKESR